MKIKSFVTATLSLILGAVIATSFGHAQQVKPDDDASNSINEQTIYIPYDKLREVFERDGRGVFLPYDKFQQLWNEARNNQPNKPDVKPPLGALITDIESTATLGKEIVNVDARLKIELLREGWHQVPLRLSNAAIRSASIAGKEARVVSVGDGQYELLVAHEGNEPKTVELELSYAKALTKSGGQSVVAFQSPQAPVNRWLIRTGQKDVDVQIEPMIASSRKTAEISADGSDTGEDGTGDEILAFVGAAPEVKIMWTPKAEGASGLAALVSAETQARFQIDQGVARTSANVTLDISRAEISSVSLNVPNDQKVVSVFDRNVKKWEVKPGDQAQTIMIELFEPTLGRQALSVELEKFIDEIEENSISVPQVMVNDVSRNSGVVLVNLAPGLRAEPEQKTGLLQMDLAELPGNLANQKWEFAYRYASLPFGLSLKVKKILPLISVDQLVQVSLTPEKIWVGLSAVYDIQQAGVFQLDLAIPKEFEIRSVQPLSRQGLELVPVDTFYRDPQNENRVIVTLSKKAIGKLGLAVALERELDDANLLSPTDIASTIEFQVPKSTVNGIEFSKGHLVVYAPESLQVNAASTNGLRNESFQNALALMSSSPGQPGVRPILAFSFSHTDASVALEAKRRRPQVTVEQVVVTSVQSGVVKYDTRLFYEVLYSGVKSTRLDVPTRLIGDLRNRSTSIVQQPFDPQPDDVAEGYTAWELTGDSEFFGKHEIRYTWEQKIPDLPLGESVDVTVDRLAPAGVDRASGQIVLTKSETIDIRPKPDATGLRPIDPQTDLTQGVQVENAATAFEFVDDWSLSLTATRFELQELKRTSISRAVIRAVALRQNELSVQCLYQMRSVGQRVSLQMPAGFDSTTSFDDQPIRINGQRVTPERGGKDLIYVPLTGLNSDRPFLLEVRYTIPGDAGQIDLPLFTDEPAIQKVFLCVYLPFERALISKSGDWTDEAIDEHTRSIASLLGATNPNSLVSRMFSPRKENVDNLLNWVQEGIDGSPARDQKFEVDGRPYVFSALRPEPAPAGSVRLRTMNMTLLNGLVCGLIGLIGLLLIRARLTTQIAGALLVVAGLVVAGVFFPLIMEHIFGEALLITSAVVGAVWLVSDAGRWLRALQRIRRERQAQSRPLPELAPAGAAVSMGDSAGNRPSDSGDVGDSPPIAPKTESNESRGDKEGDSQ